MEYASIERFIRDFNRNVISSTVFDVLINDEYYKLPSGNYGNILALAMEIHCYTAANYIVLNNDRFNFDLDSVAYNSRKSLSALDVFKQSIKNRPNGEIIERFKYMPDLYNKLRIEYLLDEAGLAIFKANLILKSSKIDTSIKM